MMDKTDLDERHENKPTPEAKAKIEALARASRAPGPTLPRVLWPESAVLDELRKSGK